MTIQAIETRYAGCRFRSRLEARWAVFFDHAGVRWEYEPQGFVIGARPYLPDFLLPDCGTWVEVKGDEAMLDKPLMHAAAEHLPEMPYRYERGPKLMVLGPIPAPLKIGANHLGRDDFDWAWNGLDFRSWSPDEQPMVTHCWYGFGSYHKNKRPWQLWNTSTHPSADVPEGSWLIPEMDCYESGIPDAYIAARSARFEHGERGA